MVVGQGASADSSETARESQVRRFAGASPRSRIAVVAMALVVAAAGRPRLAVRALDGTAHSGLRAPLDDKARRSIQLATNGEIAFSGGEQPGGSFLPSNLFVVQPDGSGLRQLSRDDWRRNSLDWSPDGSKIVYVRTGGEFPLSNIFASDAYGRHTRQLTAQSNQYENTLAWSPDGKTIAFARGGSNGPYEIYLMDSDGANVRRLTSGGGNHLSPSWSPDGSRIVFVATPASNSGLTQLFEMSADGTGSHRLTQNRGWESFPAWSPDATAIAFVLRGLDDNPPDRLVLIAPDGSDARTIYECTAGCDRKRGLVTRRHAVAVEPRTRGRPRNRPPDVAAVRHPPGRLGSPRGRHRSSASIPGRSTVENRTTITVSCLATPSRAAAG
jgi:dipeptidyl aminopeptidase/acylaminoacyl peptidase